ncbi:heme lyase CcmF/NrfE family subunit [Testudinibacter sp. TR-2022]|uniref:heme lyase CcmF/NrfE family subunit n=1 Tax=Testudinibacter sp. TR-2022 TaxID=2585029 RepID=UPI00111BB517|nr:heme lyase CcmF/NrfE family subunit [Testudinibacter sp. TR-2022]TNH06829.1 heme lyase CcmF/NrfE family subunit [Pasteurellaceae bacterium Phil11]TNH25632.1 heme lyase CcmF/NrfE family subunit [Testudinibacter sp. TR-2022]TNH27056.1 heme lyase CcmF/NrfE family subunit [Testudinibacter sp. TR-2022]
MLPEFGYFALICSFMTALVLLLIPFLPQRLRWVSATPLLSVWLFLSALAAITILAYCFVQDDFSVLYVASHSNTELPRLFKIAATWGGHEGSMLFWLVTLSLWTMLFALFNRSADRLFTARVVAVLALIYTALCLYTLILSDPFERLFPTPFQGRDLNPMLQDIALVFHPPLLYLGYVGFALNFALSIVTLLCKTDQQTFAAYSRRWALLSWGWLTCGILLGAWWAYYELGWGGWWFWDPVENASLMPWLLGLGLIHSLIATQRHGLYPYWSLLLSLLAFSASLLGTFIVRSGVITSVHAFSIDPSRGYALLAMFFLFSGMGLGIFALKAKIGEVRSATGWFSQPTALLLLNILTAIAAFSVLLGTFYPLLFSTFGFGSISVGAPYFNTIFTPLVLCCLLVMLLWLNGRARHWQRYLLNMLPALVCTYFVIDWNIRLDPLKGWQGLAFTFVLLGFWLLFSLLHSAWSAYRQQRLKTALPMLFGHAGLGLVVIAAMMSGYYASDLGVKLAAGEQARLHGYQFDFKGNEYRLASNYTTDTAHLNVTHNGTQFALYPEKRFYDIRNSMMSEVAIQNGVFGDLYVVLGDKSAEQRYSFGFHYKPLIQWLWLGGLLMALGAFLSIVLSKRRVL